MDIFFWFLLFTVSYSHSRTISSPDGVENLLKRILPEPEQTSFFILKLSSSEHADSFSLYSQDGKIVIEGTTPTSLSSGVNYYLRNFLHTTYEWHNYQLDGVPTNTSDWPLPPPVSLKMTQTRNVPWTYYENVCTVSYTQAFWEWEEWEQHLDWMALKGINLPLAFTGQEYVWWKTFEQFNLTFEDLKSFFGGPGFFAWSRMGNMQGWGNFGDVLDESHLTDLFKLQLKILSRMEELGMTPVLSAFAGHVPNNFATHFPNANISLSPNWGGFEKPFGEVHLLDFNDPLFEQVGNAFIAKQIELFGNVTHYYNCDTFNEMKPSSNDPEYLRKAGQQVYESMVKSDPDAVWVMQGWLFLNDKQFWQQQEMEAYLSGVPSEKMLILDLYSEIDPVWDRTQDFYGKPFIWNALHNFGGNDGILANLNKTVSDYQHALKTSKTIQGIGITMEGIWQNYVLYDMVLSSAWNNSIRAEDFVQSYALQRYGSTSQEIRNTWSLLYHSAYNVTHWGGVTKNAMVLSPHQNMSRDGFMPTNIYYDPKMVQKAWASMLQVPSDSSFWSSHLFFYDVVDIGRQVLSDEFFAQSMNLAAQIQNKDKNAVQKISTRMLQLMDDLDLLLSTDKNWMLGPWLERAKKKGKGSKWWEFNARRQITLWGPGGQIGDYASKQWQGLISTYYKPRWELYLNYLVEYNLELTGNEEWFKNQLYEEIELPWQYDLTLFPIEPIHDTKIIACSLLEKYLPPNKCG